MSGGHKLCDSQSFLEFLIVKNVSIEGFKSLVQWLLTQVPTIVGVNCQ